MIKIHSIFTSCKRSAWAEAKPAHTWAVAFVLVLISIGVRASESIAGVDVIPMLSELNVHVSMRDGVALSTDIYRPDVPGPVPVVLTRSPYGKGSAGLVDAGRWWVEHGYAFVVQDVRGRGDSDGVFYPLIHEADDGFDTLAWIGRQPWSTGKVGMIGGSYGGWTQVYAAISQSPFLRAIIPLATPPDPDRNFPMTFGINYINSGYWLAFVDGRVNQENRASFDLDAVYRTLPLDRLDASMGRNLPAWHDWLAHPLHDDYWKAQSYQEKLLKAHVAALYISGWYDTVAIGAPENFSNMSERADDPITRQNQRLIIGPWPHGVGRFRRLGAIDFGPEAIIDIQGVQLRWFDHWLKDIDNGVERDARVRVFMMGANKWIDETEWPVARTRYTKYFLHSAGHANTRWGDGRLDLAAPTAETPDRFSYDPTDPVPFLGWLSAMNREPPDPEGPGPDDYRGVEARRDVLTYTTEAFKSKTEVCGPVRVKLFASTTALDTDWTARILDVFPTGFAQRLQDGIIRGRFRTGNERETLLTPGVTYDYDIHVWPTCTEFQEGHRLRLEISSSAFPMFDRNLNTGGKLGTESQSIVANQTVRHDRIHASYVLLPVIVPRE